MDVNDWFAKGCHAHDAGQYRKAFRIFMKAALEDEVNGMGWVAAMYSGADICTRRLDKAMQWDIQAIEHGDCVGLGNLAVSYWMVGDLQASRHFLEQALAAGDNSAALKLAKLYSVSDKETARVRRLLKVVFSDENAVAPIDLEEAQVLLDELDARRKGSQGKGTQKGKGQRQAQQTKYAKQDDRAQSLPAAYGQKDGSPGVAVMLEKPRERKQRIRAMIEYELGNYKKAFKAFKALAKTYGNVHAMNCLGHMLHDGEGVTLSYEQSIKWFDRAVERGHVQSMVDLARVYRDKGEFGLYRYFLERAFWAGNDEAALLLAKLYAVSDKEVQRVKGYLAHVVKSKTAAVNLVYEAKVLLKQYG